MKKKYKIILIILGVLIVFRLFLPAIVLHYANKSLETVPGYFGHINDIDIALLRGAYVINTFYLNKVDSVTFDQTPFLSAKTIDLSVEWRALFKGRLVGELQIHTPRLIFTKDKADLEDVQKDTTDFRVLLDKFMPLNINTFEIHNGELKYKDNSSKPVVDVSLQQTHVLAKNLSTVVDKNIILPATINAEAKVYEGELIINMKLNPLADQPTFDVNTEVKNTNLVLLNDFFKAYGKFDVNKGNFGLYSEMAAKEGKFVGYVKPLIKDLDILGPEDKNDNFFHKAWEGIVGTTGFIFQNQKKDQLASKVEIKGDLKNPETQTLDALWQVLRNAFIQALVPAIDNEINLKSIDKESDKPDNLLEKIFGSKKEKGKGKAD
jgi:hypothetical protein